MSDTLAAATLAAAVIKKMDISGVDVEREAVRLFRRYSTIIKRAKEAEGKADAAQHSTTS